MKLITTAFLSLVAAAGIVSATPVKTVQADLVNVGSPLLQGNVYVGPYTLNVNGTNFAALCIDFQDHATVGTTYSAYETNLSSNSLSNTYNPTWSKQYQEEAYLMTLIVKPNADRTDIQDAAWAITDSKFKASTSAQSFINLALANYTTVDLSTFDIISGVDPNCDDRTQEFLIDPSANVATPEPSTMLLMGGGLLVAGLAGRKMAKKA